MSELWVFIESGALKPGPVVLSAEEARHVATRRLRVGASLVVFDGQGSVASARLESAEKRSALVDVGEVQRAAKPESRFVLASAIPKGDRSSGMLQGLTQLGVPVWQPLILDDSAVRKLDPAAARIQRILIESAKVARRPWCLEVRAPTSLGALLEGSAVDGAICFGDREGESDGLPADVGCVIIGPEAGFSAAERKRLEESAARPHAFGDYNLRIEIAAVAAAAAFNLRSRPAASAERETGPCDP